MRLVNVHSLELHSFSGKQPPPYATLSHRWTGEETTFEDFIDPNGKRGPGYDKIKQCCDFVARHRNWRVPNGVDWVWIDTCCIDKRSSAELSEAINSMSVYYFRSAYCVAHLADVPSLSLGQEAVLERFEHSEWFRRGWTLQELLFPVEIVFCNVEWCLIGFKRSDEVWKAPEEYKLAQRISRVTTIPEQMLFDVRLIYQQSVARRMSWSAKRVTTRLEDAAYCLLGIFEINMPLLYGEGTEAFIRLQEEIIRQTNDESLFAWTTGDFRWRERWSLLAKHPSHFSKCGDVHRMQVSRRPPYRIANQCLEFESKAIRLKWGNGDIYIIELNCCTIPGLEDYGDLDNVNIRMTPARTCLIAVRESENGVHQRALHGDSGQELVAHIKRTCSKAEASIVEKKLFVIALTKSAANAAVVLKPESFPILLQLESCFDVLQAGGKDASESEGEASPTHSFNDGDEWY